MKVEAALRAGASRLAATGIEAALLDARALLAYAIGLDAGRLSLHLGDAVSAEVIERFEAALRQREGRKPVSQIVGYRDFWSLRLKVTEAVLDPRPETEILVAEAVKDPAFRVLDLGTGSGAILLAVLKGLPLARGIGVDISSAALEVARDNAKAHGLIDRARFALSDWFAAVEGRFDLILSNPPYIAADEMAALAPEVRDHEPHLALTPGGDGLDAYRRIARGAGARLMSGGRLMVEIGPTQAPAVYQIFADQGFVGLRVVKDLDGRDRVIVARAQGQGETCGAT